MTALTSSARRAAALLAVCLCALLPAGASHAQTAKEALRDFDFVVDVVRRDYAGYQTKAVGAGANEFEKLVLAKRMELARTPSRELAIIEGVLA